MIAIRGLTPLLPLIRDSVASEADAAAAREDIRALALLGTVDDVALAVRTASKWPRGMDNALAISVARRGGAAAVDLYASMLRKTRMNNHAEFFRVALWGQTKTVAFTGSRMLSGTDESGWSGVLAALADSDLPMSPGVLASSLGSLSEEIRSASLWFLVRGYAGDPTRIGDVVKEALAEPRAELSSNREDFGRELLRRMLGGERRDDPRWLKFLESEEADALLQGDDPALQYLTDAEYAIRYNRCEVQSKTCALPKKRGRLDIPSQPVAPPAFNLPEVLPAGLADAIVSGARCHAEWLGVARASVDQAGRVTTLDLEPITTTASCKKALDTVLRLSMATNTSLRSEFSGGVLLAGSARSRLCLDEEPPSEEATSTFRVDGAIQPPVVTRRVEPEFPSSALQRMTAGQSVLVIAESVIARSGCVRNIRILLQSPMPEINGAAVMALSQWKFRPGYLDGKPVDVIFNLTLNFKTSR